MTSGTSLQCTCVQNYNRTQIIEALFPFTYGDPKFGGRSGGARAWGLLPSQFVSGEGRNAPREGVDHNAESRKKFWLKMEAECKKATDGGLAELQYFGTICCEHQVPAS